MADNFPPVRGLFALDLKPSINQTTLSLDRQDRAFELRKKKFFDLARRFRAATDPRDVERLRDEMGRMISGV